MTSSVTKSNGQVGWPERKIKITESGFAVIEDGSPEEVCCRWESVLEVFAYKIDLFSYDEICLGFRSDATGNHWWVGESYTGYLELLEELPRKFPGIRTDWLSEVMLPAFAENRTSLWGEALVTAACVGDSTPNQRRPWWKLWT